MTGSITCVSCSQQFETVVECGITLDYCTACQLIWFDKNELDQYCHRNAISIRADDQPKLQLDVACPKCSDLLFEVRHGSATFCVCENCGGYLVSSLLIDRKLPGKTKTRPLQQLDGSVSFLELLNAFLPWW